MQFVRVNVLDDGMNVVEDGKICSDGRHLWAVPSTSLGLRNMISTPILALVKGELTEVDPSQPLEFLRALPFMYHGSRLWCDEPEEATGLEAIQLSQGPVSAKWSSNPI